MQERRVRRVPVVVLAGAAALLAVAGARPDRLAHPATWVLAAREDPTAPVALAATSAAWLLVAWLAAGVATTAAAGLPGRVGRACGALSRRTTPVLLRRLVEAALGAGLVLGGTGATGGPALAAAATAEHTGAPVAAVATTPRLPPDLSPHPAPGLLPAPGEPVTPTTRTVPGTGSPVADLPAPGPPAATPGARAAAPRPVDGDGAVVVHAGDCLWDLARAHLGDEATDAQVAAEWPRWWRANASVIGRDPGLLLPGQRLLPPR